LTSSRSSAVWRGIASRGRRPEQPESPASPQCTVYTLSQIFAGYRAPPSRHDEKLHQLWYARPHYRKETIMAQQLPRPKDHVEVYWFSEQPYGHVTDADLQQYESGRLGFPNTYFDPEKAHVLYNQYHEQYAWADEVGFDGIMSNEHHASYWCMKPAVNLDAAVIAKVTKRAKIAILGNVIAVNDPIRMAEEIAMLDCFSGGRIISGFVRGTAVETLQSGIDPTENRGRFEEAHDLIIKCWTTPGPFRYEGKYYQYRAIN